MRSVGSVPVDSLLLDPINPRLPEDEQHGSQDELLTYLYDHDVLEELGASFVANGYFGNEQLLVLPEDERGHRIVVEGNRRASALMILLQTEAAVTAGIAFGFEEQPSAERLVELSAVPCMELRDRDELRTYLGYRHIGGIRPWSAEAKARWIHANVLLAADAGTRDPFYDVGRRFGSNSRGVRTSFAALEILRLAADELGIETSAVQRRRYSVWGLLVGNPNVQRYLRYDRKARTFQEVTVAIRDIDEGRLKEVLTDLVPRRGEKKAVLNDSRQVSEYASVLVNRRAHETLREYRDLDLAVSVLEQGGLVERLTQVKNSLEVLLVDASRLQVDEDSLTIAGEAAQLARGVTSVIRGRLTQS